MAQAQNLDVNLIIIASDLTEEINTMPRIPAKYVDEFMRNPRIKGLSPKGTKVADIAVMKRVISETLSNPAFMERLVNYAMPQAEVTLRKTR